MMNPSHKILLPLLSLTRIVSKGICSTLAPSALVLLDSSWSRNDFGYLPTSSKWGLLIEASRDAASLPCHDTLFSLLFLIARSACILWRSTLFHLRKYFPTLNLRVGSSEHLSEYTRPSLFNLVRLEFWNRPFLLSSLPILLPSSLLPLRFFPFLVLVSTKEDGRRPNGVTSQNVSLKFLQSFSIIFRTDFFFFFPAGTIATTDWDACSLVSCSIAFF